MSEQGASPGRVAAFFDLDRTLIDVNSGLLYARFERSHGRISRAQMARSVVWLVLYHFSLVDMERALDTAVEHYRGVPDRDLDARTRSFFHQQIATRLQPGARRALEAHREQSHPLVMLTSSSIYLARVSSETFGLDHFIANRFPVDDAGLLEGTLARPVCYGPGKVSLAQSWADAHGVDLDRSFFYSDSLSDAPMLERVGQPRVVNPDPRLKRLARRRRWPILDWRT